MISVVIRHASRIGAFLAGLGILGMMLVGAIDVIGLFAFNAPLPGGFEITEALMVASVFLAMALAQFRGGHVRVEIFLHLFPKGVQRTFDLFSHLLTMAFFALICWISWDVAINSVQVGEFSSGLIQFPVWPARIALAVGCTLITLQAANDAAVVVGLAPKPEDQTWNR